MAEKSVSVVSASATSGSMASMSSQAERGKPTSATSQVLFHFYDELTRKVKVPKFLYWIFNIYALIQVWGTSMWLWNGNLWVNSKVGNIICWIISIGPIQDDGGSALIISIIIPVAVVCVGLAMVIFQVLNYAKMREFITWTLYPTRFCLELVAMIVILPTTVTIGSVITEILNKGMNSTYIAFLVVLVIMVIACSLFYCVTTLFVNSSAYLPANPFAIFSGGRMATFYVGNACLIMIHILFSMYPRWAQVVCMISHLALCVYEAYKFTDRTLINSIAHITFNGFLYACILLDVLAIVVCMTGLEIEAIWLFVMGLVILVGSIIGSALLWIRLDKRKICQLAYNQVMNKSHPDYKVTDDEVDDQERAERLKQLCSSKQKAIAYVMVGFANACDTFVDMSLVKMAVTLHQDIEMVTICLKLLVLFPGSYRLSNLMLADLIKYRGLGYAHQFIRFQVDKIRVTRQTSSSTAGAAKLKEMNVFVNECEIKTRSIWGQKTLEYPQTREIYTMVERTSAKCTEILNDFPNSTHHLEQHIRFLIECSTDFSGAIVEKHKTEMIEAGHSYAIDYAFKSMVRMFPIYLKRKIVDVKGEFIQGGRVRKDATSGSGNSLSMSSSDTIDQAVEETIGKSLINQSKTRLAFQEATRERKFAGAYRLTLVLIAALLGAIVLFGVMTIIYANFFESRNTTIQRDQQANRARLYLSAACLSLLFDFGKQTDRYNHQGLEQQWLTEANDFKLFDVRRGYDYQAQEMFIESRDYFTSFLKAVTSLSTSLNVYEAFGILFSESVQVRQCHNAKQTEPINMTLRAIYTYSLMNAMVLDGSNATYWYENNNYFCNIFGAYTTISEAFAELRWLSCDRATQEMVEDQKVLDLLIIVVPAILGVVIVLPTPILMCLLVRELKLLCKMMMGLEDDARKAAANPLMRGDDDTRPLEHSDTVSHDSSFVATGIAFACFAVLGMVSIVMFIQNIHTYNLKFEHVSNWLYYCTLLKPQAVEVIQSLAHLVYLSCGEIHTNAIDLELETARINQLTERMQSELTDFLQDTEMVPTILGEHEDIDNVLLNPSCDITDDHDENYHEMYKCQTLNNMVVMFIQSASEVISLRETYNCRIYDEKLIHIIHMMNQHLEKLLTEMDTLFDVLLDEYTKQYQTRLFMWLAFGLVAAFGMFISGYLFQMYGEQAYQGAMMILRRVSPTGIVANPQLMGYLLNRNHEKHHEVMTTTKGIIHNARDGIICTSSSGIIETVNTSVSDILGYIPAQILGQHMGIILDEGDSEKIMNQMSMIVSKEAARVYKDTVTCLNDNNMPVQCSITLMGMEGDRGDITSFVAVIKDITSLIDQQKEAEEAKARSEKLLYEILPRDIVNRIQQGEKDITFVVPSASIMFIDIAKFSEYASRLNPQEIMGNLSQIFGGYDALLPKYPLITKIKLIGDVYMAAAGLFEEVEPKEHASQMIQFAFEALNALEEVNTKLDAVLSVRIGVNTGGPIIAGVLGTDKPVFDIIGDPINIAARLQSTSIPNRIQISESTYEAIKDMEFSVEPRGEVFLKGKGMRPAYLVNPGIAFTLSNVLSSSQSGQISGPLNL